MLMLIAMSAALAADRHHAAPAPADTPRAGWSQPMQPATIAPDAPPADMPQGTGPRATSGGQAFDTVAVAQPDGGGTPGIAIAAAGATPGSVVELTELGHGHTILALVGANPPPGGTVLLSEGAFQALGVAPGAGVRVRAALPSPQDQNALRSGGAASARIDAPEVLLKALRKRVPQSAVASLPPVDRPVRAPVAAPPTRAPRHAETPAEVRPVVAAPRPPRVTAPAPVPRSGYIVQVAALSAAPRAAALARTLGGRVVGGGGLYRVQLGPYGDVASANRARDGAVRRGYRDARVAHTE